MLLLYCQVRRMTNSFKTINTTNPWSGKPIQDTSLSLRNINSISKEILSLKYLIRYIKTGLKSSKDKF